MNEIRRAQTDEAGELSELAFRSKAHWGYDAAFMEACREELAVPASAFDTEIVRLCLRDGQIAGFYRLVEEPEEGEGAWEIEAFFVDPSFIGTGVGKALWHDLLEQARMAGASLLISQSDPDAEGFYATMGMVRTGERPSASIEGRMLPLLELQIEAEG